MDTDPRYPIGRFVRPQVLTAEERLTVIREIAAAPAALAGMVDGLSAEQLDTPYREGGWTVRQLVHHVADSHLNAYIRFKLGLTEDTPTICAYKQDRWAETSDNALPAQLSLEVLSGVHRRWGALLDAMREADWQRTIRHPESGVQTLEQLAALYAWHGRHHVAHIKALRETRGW